MERSASKSEQWISSLKIAIVENNHEDIYKLVVDIPEFDTFEQAQEAHSMIESSIDMFVKERNNAKKNMQNIQKMKQFLMTNKKSKFDRKS
jgi:hypothetical protein